MWSTVEGRILDTPKRTISAINLECCRVDCNHLFVSIQVLNLLLSAFDIKSVKEFILNPRCRRLGARQLDPRHITVHSSPGAHLIHVCLWEHLGSRAKPLWQTFHRDLDYDHGRILEDS